MSTYRMQPPWDFLLTASRTSLQSYELSRLAHAANLRKELIQLMDSWIEESASALFARWMMEQRARPAHDERATTESEQACPAVEATAEGSAPASDNVFADSRAISRLKRGPS